MVLLITQLEQLEQQRADHKNLISAGESRAAEIQARSHSRSLHSWLKNHLPCNKSLGIWEWMNFSLSSRILHTIFFIVYSDGSSNLQAARVSGFRECNWTQLSLSRLTMHPAQPSAGWEAHIWQCDRAMTKTIP